MLENIILGSIQGLAEWLPVSSEGILVLVQTRFFNSDKHILELIRQSLFLHLGTVLAVVIYFRKDIWRLIKISFGYSPEDKTGQKVFEFILITALITGLLGYSLLSLLVNFEKEVELTGRVITGIIGVLLLVTGFLQLRAKKKEPAGLRPIKRLNQNDNLILGMMQALAVLPGMSRSGMTVSGLLLRKFDEQTALRLSFLMSVPVIIGGNIILNLKYLSYQLSLDLETLLGLFFAFIFGWLTINLFLRLAKRINFGYFVLFFGILILIFV